MSKKNKHGGVAEESGSVDRAPDEAVIDIPAQTQKLKQEEAWRKGLHSSRTLLYEREFSVLLVAFKPHSRLREQRADGRQTLHVLHGRVTMRVSGMSTDLRAGQVLCIAPGVVHDLEAADESLCLLTVMRH